MAGRRGAPPGVGGAPRPAPRPYDDRDRPLFSVGQVAEMLEVQQAFLRRLDQQEMVSPARTEGDQRRYSKADIDRVSEICDLVGEGLTLAGVRRVLELQAEVVALQAEVSALRAASRRRG